MQTMNTEFDWSHVAGAVSEILPDSDVDTLCQLGSDQDAGLRHIAEHQHLTVREAEEILHDRLLVRPNVHTFKMAAE